MALLHQVDSYVNVKYDYIINWGTEVNLYESYDYSFDTISVGKYIVKSQKCVISDIQAELSISRERVLRALKVLENRKVIITEGRIRKVLIEKESDLLRALRYEPLVQSNAESPKRIDPAESTSNDFSIDDIDISRIEHPDPILQDVIKFVISEQVGSVSDIQRKFEIGYNRAGRISDQLEKLGVLGPNKGQEGRDVLIGSNGKIKENNTRKESVKKPKSN
jgi:DNA segregation ATPase FtsK/SpoIIIE-like protein